MTKKSSTSESDDILTLTKALNQAINMNPRLFAERSKSEAMAQIPEQQGALPEPNLSFNVANLPIDDFSFNQTPMTQIKFSVSQAIPYPGKLELRKKSADFEAKAMSTQVLESEQQLIWQVRHQWWQMFYLDRALDTIQRNQTLLQQFIDVAQTKYVVGQGLQQDVLLAQVELSKLLDKQLQLTGTRRKHQANMNFLLGRELMKNLTLPDTVSESLPALKLEQLLSQAKQDRQQLNMARYQEQAARARFELAKKDYYPDFKFGVGYGWRDDQTDFVNLQVSMNLPIYTNKRQDRAKDQRNQQWLERKYALEDLTNNIAKQIETALADYQVALEQVGLYKTNIIPQAKQTVDAMLAGYQVNKVDFLNLMQAQITLFNYETRYWQVFSRANQALAALSVAVGKELDHE